MIMDIDMHVLEPIPMPLDEPFTGREPVFVRLPDGSEKLYFDGLFHSGNIYNRGRNGLPGKYSLYGHHRGKGKSPRGGEDLEDTMKDMDIMGMDAALLFPTAHLNLGQCLKGEVGAAICRAYNDWIANYVSKRPDRFFAAGIIPWADVNLAMIELKRCAEQHEISAFMLHSNTGRNLGDPELHPFYELAQDLDVALMVHPRTGSYNPPEAGIDRFGPISRFYLTSLIAFPFENMISVASVVGGGILEKFPKLRIAFLESGAGWVPYLCDRMDEAWEPHSQLGTVPDIVPLTKLPSEYVKMCYFSCEPSESTLPLVAKIIPEKVMFSSDYPHFDSSFPQAVSEIEQNADLNEAQKRAILGENAARLLKINA